MLFICSPQIFQALYLPPSEQPSNTISLYFFFSRTKALVRSAGFRTFSTLCLECWPAGGHWSWCRGGQTALHSEVWSTCCSAGTSHPGSLDKSPDFATSLCPHLQSEGFAVHPPDMLFLPLAYFRIQWHVSKEEERNWKSGNSVAKRISVEILI